MTNNNKPNTAGILQQLNGFKPNAVTDDELNQLPNELRNIFLSLRTKYNKADKQRNTPEAIRLHKEMASFAVAVKIIESANKQ